MGGLQSLTCALAQAVSLRRRRWGHVFLLAATIALTALTGSAFAQLSIEYIYDEAGRVVGVIDGPGGSAQYEYDEAGNVTAIRRFSPGDLALIEFTPNAGPVGTVVEIHGVGFSASASGNIVRFNGTAATAISASTTKLLVTVPAGAATGTLSVAVETKTATSRTPFTVTASDGAPEITDFTPKIGAAGTAVTITGANFDSAPANNAVRFNIMSATVTAVSATQIATKVPFGATSGPIQVNTPNGSVTSAADFIVPPAGYSADQIGTTTRIVVDGAPGTFNTGAAGKVSLVLFKGFQGQNLGLGVSALTTIPANNSVSVSVFAPNGGLLLSCGAYSTPGGTCNLPTLPRTGTYTIAVAPPSAVTANLTLTLSTDVTGTIVPNAAPMAFISNRVGQNGRYTFTTTAGQNFSLLITDNTFGPGETRVMVHRPDGTILAGTTLTYGGNGPGTTGLFDFSVPGDGIYTVHVDPRVASGGGLALSLLGEATGPLTIDGAPTNVSLLAGQNGRYTFSASAGQNLGFGVSALSTTPTGGSVTLQIRKPDNTVFSCGSFASPGGSCNLTNLTAGSYAIEVDPDRRSATMTLTLSSDVSGTLVINPTAPTTFATTRTGQNARYSFGGTAAQSLTIVLAGNSFGPESLGWTVLRANGSSFYAGSLDAPGKVFDLPPLPANETYSLFLDPPGISTGNVAIAMRAPATGNLVIDGPPTPVALAQGQRGRFTFPTTAGQHLGLGISGLALTPAGTALISVQGPNNEALGHRFLSSGSDSLTLWYPPAGTATVEVDAGASAVNLTLTLSSDITGTLTPNGPAQTFSTMRIGQNGRYTLTATEGQRLALSWNGTTFSQVEITLLKPDGDAMFSGLPLSSPGLHEWVAVAGTYQLLVDPTGGATGSVTFQLATDLTGTLPVDGPALNVSLLPGQRARYTFTGAPGDNVGLGVSALSTTPTSAQTTTVTVLNPASASIASRTLSAPGGSIGLPTLAGAGNHTVAIVPSGGLSTQMTLTLSRDLTGSIVPNGPAIAFSPTRVGQKGRYTFTGTGNQSAAMFLSGATPGNSARVDVAGPSGAVDNAVVNGTDSFLWELGVLLASGPYTVVVTPDSAVIGSVSLALVTDLTGVLTVDGPSATPIATKPGQNARFTFSGTAGARYAVVATGIGTTPTGGSVFLSVVAANNATIKSCGSQTADTICDVPPLPANGTYTVVVDPDGTNAASLNVAVKSDVTGTVTVDAGAPTATTWTPGQNVRLTFTNPAVGTTLKLTVSDLSIAPAGAKARLRVRDPSGANIFGNTFWVFPNNQGTGYSINLPALTATGVYTIEFDPQEFASGSASFALATTIVKAIDIDGPPVTVSWQPNQQAVLNFSTSTANQAITLSFSNMSTTPAGGALRYTMSNATSWTTNITAPGVNLPQLPLASVREYSMTLAPQGPQSGTVTVVLINDVVGTLTVGGPAVSHTPATAGQSARFQFTNSTAGRQGTITINSSQWASGQWWLVPPSGGATIGSFGVVTTPVNRSVTLSQTGTYTLILVPAGTSAGTVSLSVK